MEFETDATGWDARRLSASLHMFGNGSSASALHQPGDDVTALPKTLHRPASGVLLTPNIVIPTGTARLQVQCSFFGTGTGR